MAEMDLSRYTPAVAELLQKLPLMPLGPGEPDRSAKSALEALKDSAFAPAHAADRDMAAACRAGLWLAFGHLDESHTISQELHTTEGSYRHVLAQGPQLSQAKHLPLPGH